MIGIARRRSGSRDDAGFTLVELLVTIVVLGIIIAPLSAVILTYLKNTDATTARMSESHDAQLATSYFAQDVQSVGVRAPYVTTGEPPFVQSIETGAPAGGGLYPCGAAGTPAAVVRFAWDDFADATAASRTQARVAYVVEGSELHRIRCVGSAAPVDIVIAHNLVAPSATVSCANASGTPMSCTAPTLPSTVSLVLTIQDPDSGSSSPYEVTLTGQRRQT
jgi:prepilin-type N-terminal cleavage/methylation domain-containing protein